MAEKPLRLSSSALDTLARCPQMYYRRYILHEPDVLGAPMILGRAFHKALEINFLNKMEHGTDLPMKEVVSIYRDVFEMEADKPEFVDLESLEESVIDWQGETPRDMRDQGEKALKRYVRDHAPFINPESVELKVERVLDNNIVLVGMMDLVTTDGLVIDYKLSAYPWKNERVNLSLQPTCYAALLEQAINFHFHFVTRTKKPQVGISIKRTQRTHADIDWLINEHIPQAAKFIRSGNFIRNPGLPCGYCAHRLGCGYRV